jgi:hypothetical protein
LKKKIFPGAIDGHKAPPPKKTRAKVFSEDYKKWTLKYPPQRKKNKKKEEEKKKVDCPCSV